MRSITIGWFLMCGLAAGQGGTDAAVMTGHEVKTDRTVLLWYRAPTARTVRVSCDCADGVKALVKGEDGVWSVTVGPLLPKAYKYTYIVDGLSVLLPGQFEVKAVHQPVGAR
jgi:enterochelin esterase family protein